MTRQITNAAEGQTSQRWLRIDYVAITNESMN